MAHAHLPLGKKPFVHDSRDLALKNYIDKAVLISSESCPLAHDWDAVPTPAGGFPEPDTDDLGNAAVGCCVYAGPGHMVKMIGQQTSDPIIVTKQMVISAYAEDTCYNPATGDNDNGANIRDMLKRWKTKGLYGTKLLVYALVNWNDPTEVALASWLGCGTIGGFALPKASQGQTDAQGRPLWFVPVGGFPSGQGPGTWGGHCIWTDKPSPALDGGNSWGEKTYWTTGWDNQCCDERWLCIIDRWRMATGRAPNGFAFDDLLADAKIRATSNP